MAVATVTLTTYGYPKGMRPAPRRYNLIGSAAVAASPATYQTNGLPLTWGTIMSADGGLDVQPRADVPDSATFRSIVGGIATYGYDPAHNTLRINVAGAELTNGTAIPASVSGDTIEFDAIFQKV